MGILLMGTKVNELERCSGFCGDFSSEIALANN